MDIDKDEIAEELDHHRKMLKELRRRLRERELQEVQYGISVPPEITSDIYKINERIQQHESEIARLQTLAAEEEEPIGEVEYRAVLAEIWEKGEPTYAGLTRLELIRLRHGILRERANELEKEVRAIVVVELLANDYEVYVSSIVESICNISNVLDEDGELIASNGTSVFLIYGHADREELIDMIFSNIEKIKVDYINISYLIRVNEASVCGFISSKLSPGRVVRVLKLINSQKYDDLSIVDRALLIGFLSKINQPIEVFE